MMVNNQQVSSGTIIWLTGWSMPVTVFDPLRELLPDFHHVSVDYSQADSPETMLRLTETEAKNVLSSDGSTFTTSGLRGPLLIGGWSLGGLLALRLAAIGLADGLVLFAATARFTRPKAEADRGWADAHLRQMMTGLMKDRTAVETRFRQMLLTEIERAAGLGSSLPSSGSWTTPALIAGLQVLRSEEILSQLKKINYPVFLIHGTEDRICPYAAGSELASRLPQAELLTILSCGHAPFVGRECEIAEEVRRWRHEQQDSFNSASI
ncbi:alpha/beta hydrolase [Paenibacillus mendelii]|uniref:Alpha/beta hydrolase n=1 Tax=Paenibacillus mendelii TaxID=206163 RepID=A0ABV6JIR8_9BACL|nr:alpha/beta fold hydrolase [Paenibacillus mendelii]MCQ6557327.1 alpha/beta hydrolase [Paenibacillus mendelii]